MRKTECPGVPDLGTKPTATETFLKVVWGLTGTQAARGSTGSSGAYQLVPSFALEPRLDKQVCIF